MSRPSSAEIIRGIRLYAGWTQSQLAHQLAISVPQISAIEHGRINLSRRVIEILVHKLNVRRDWIETGEGEPFDKNTPPPPPQINRQTKVLATAIALTPFTPVISAGLAVGVGANEIINKIVDAYGARNPTDLAQRIFKTSQSTVASWIRRKRVPDEVVAKAIAETDLTLEDLLTTDGYVYIQQADLVEIIRRMAEEKDLRGLKPSELISLFQKCSSGK